MNKLMESLIRKPTKNSETSEILDLLIDDDWSDDNLLRVDEIITRLKLRSYDNGKEWGKYETRGW